MGEQSRSLAGTDWPISVWAARPGLALFAALLLSAGVALATAVASRALAPANNQPGSVHHDA